MNHLLRRARLFPFNGSSFSSSSSRFNDSLQRRIARAGDPSVSIIPVVEEWLDQRNPVKPSELQSIVKMLRKFKRFSHALQLLEWIAEHRMYTLSVGDMAIQLDLIAKVRGLKESDKFFEAIPVDKRDYHVYGALLNCYASKKHVRKAEATFQKMKELGFINSPLPYNVMLSLYMQIGKHLMVEKLLQEMEENNLEPDRFTVNTRLQAYAVLSNIEAMEKCLKKYETDPDFTLDWHAYVVMANAYLKAGSMEKAVEMLRRSEQLVNPESKRHAYEVFMTLYGAAGRKEDIYRLWDMYKSTGRFYNTGYASVMSALLKAEDMEGVEKLYMEWETGHLLFDMRIPHLMITGYCKKGMMEKAEEAANRVLQSGRIADASMWERLALGYMTLGQMEKAVERWKRGIEASGAGWRPNRHVFGACVEYLEGKGDGEGLREVLRLLSQRGHVVYDEMVKAMEGGGLRWKIMDAMKAKGKPNLVDAFKEDP